MSVSFSIQAGVSSGGSVGELSAKHYLFVGEFRDLSGKAELPVNFLKKAILQWNLI